jgi:DNA repair photolyase
MNVYPRKDVRFDSEELKTVFGMNKAIFVGSSCDMWAWSIPDDWIEQTLELCRKYRNEYIFQSKNPERFRKFYGKFPHPDLFGITIESNRDELVSKYSEAPATYERYMCASDMCREDGADVFISIEPVMDFDLVEFVDWIREIEPNFVSIGADSKGHHLPEPDKGKLITFLDSINEYGIEIKKKDNLKRIVEG